MNIDTGELFLSPDLARMAGVKPENIVELVGTPEAVQRISKAVRAQHKARRKAQKKSRKANR